MARHLLALEATGAPLESAYPLWLAKWKPARLPSKGLVQMGKPKVLAWLSPIAGKPRACGSSEVVQWVDARVDRCEPGRHHRKVEGQARSMASPWLIGHGLTGQARVVRHASTLSDPFYRRARPPSRGDASRAQSQDRSHVSYGHSIEC